MTVKIRYYERGTFESNKYSIIILMVNYRNKGEMTKGHNNAYQDLMAGESVNQDESLKTL